jgi:SAM-dependent methyltransferase
VFEKLNLNAASTVLDLGCGCGGLGLALRERFGVVHYTGVEINQQAAATAKAMNPAGRFLCADIVALASRELMEEAFDTVVSLSCIDWNVLFAQMLAKAYRYVKAGGHFVSSFRLTSGESLTDLRRSYQHINFEGRKEGEVAPYVILNVDELLTHLAALVPARVSGFGYWGSPSASAVTPLTRVCFAVLAVQKGIEPVNDPVIDLDLPPDLFRKSVRD